MSEAGRILKDKIQVYTTPEGKARLYAAAAAEGVTIKQFVNEAVEEKINALGYDVESAAGKTTRAKTENERGGNAKKTEKAKRAGKRKNTGNRQGTDTKAAIR